MQILFFKYRIKYLRTRVLINWSLTSLSMFDGSKNLAFAKAN
ncbi:hypothetical protein NMS_0093 [Nonlabens marinus S1-08]|uniref:Uncharacterized protein n=1 Tax=Nonlabens marinus S1-08 TaxID=1454201 RepID=W8VVR2_9FLAO|nr:hypothetical protein NMS_0093 [Nonlabens marinus S1-08]